MANYNGKNVVITGGSSGIGFETAVKFARLGARLFLIARNKQKLQQTKEQIQKLLGSDVDVFIYVSNVADKEKIAEIMNEIGKNEGGIFTLINNAGAILCGRMCDNSVEKHEQHMSVNYMGMFYCLYYAWPYLKESKGGHIGFVSSVAGYVGAIGYTGYAPSKFAISGLAESIRMEAKEIGVGVTIIYPPDTETPLHDYEKVNTLAETKALSANVKLMTAESVADLFFNAILKNKFEVVCNFESKMMRVLKTIMPAFFFRSLDKMV